MTEMKREYINGDLRNTLSHEKVSLFCRALRYLRASLVVPTLHIIAETGFSFSKSTGCGCFMCTQYKMRYCVNRNTFLYFNPDLNRCSVG